MNTFKGAFVKAVTQAGFEPSKKNELVLWTRKDLPGRTDLPNAVCAAVRRDG